MTTPEVVRFADDHFRKVVYGLGPYIADYPEQALLACTVQAGVQSTYSFAMTRHVTDSSLLDAQRLQMTSIR